jgi:hypothetical protein
LLAAQGCDNAQIGRRVGVTVSTVRKWRGRRPKVTELRALYTNIPGASEVVLCIDEKSGRQALRRRFAGRLPSPREIGRWEFE